MNSRQLQFELFIISSKVKKELAEKNNKKTLPSPKKQLKRPANDEGFLSPPPTPYEETTLFVVGSASHPITESLAPIGNLDITGFILRNFVNSQRNASSV
ncbi:hypothetical protein CEXT_663561 [Caerostris extrusa]|uniref:Uncharacterized protein n=1 Tax=Caerostris extrusa TaxID=172846 RepID=A0AAV4PXG7_CAEEX|nr:hypothetical protein CEXT_663561 [Caerostris extrusa]